MELRQITEQSAEFPRAAAIYEEAFPPAEKTPIDMLLKAQEASLCTVWAVTDEGKTVGFSCLFPLPDDVLYLMFLAIDANERGHGYGTKIMQLLKETYPEKTKIFLVEKPDEKAANNEQRLKRISMYERTGFVLTEIEKEFLGVRYVAMSEQGVSGETIENAIDNLFKIGASAGEMVKQSIGGVVAE